MSMQNYPVEKYKGKFSSKFDEVIYGDYFCNDKVVQDQVNFSDLSMEPMKNIYILKKINDPDVRSKFEGSLTDDQRIYQVNSLMNISRYAIGLIWERKNSIPLQITLNILKCVMSPVIRP